MKRLAQASGCPTQPLPPRLFFAGMSTLGTLVLCPGSSLFRTVEHCADGFFFLVVCHYHLEELVNIKKKMNLGNQQCPWLFITSGAMSAELGDMCSFLLCLLEGNVMLLSEPFFFLKGTVAVRECWDVEGSAISWNVAWLKTLLPAKRMRSWNQVCSKSSFYLLHVYLLTCGLSKRRK